MDLGSTNLPDKALAKSSDGDVSSTVKPQPDDSAADSPSKISSWAKNLKLPQSLVSSQDESVPGSSGKSTFARLTSGIGLRLSPKSTADENSNITSPTSTPGFIGTLTKGIVDSSKSAVKAVQVKARHAVSQNKRRYQEGEFDLDLTYITENIIAMGFPAGDMSSGIFGYFEGLYRNHMEEVIKFLETQHKDKYKVYNLCSERLYDASLFEGKVASFPFDDHNCPPLQLITLFCQSAYSWLKEDIENVVVVHCKAGMARTGLMISSLLLYLKFYPTAEESMDYYNQKRCFDSKGLVLPSQIRYVKYFERVLTYFNGENQPGRRCMLRGFRLHKCPYWIRPAITISDHNGVLFSTKKHPRTKDLSPEDFWFSAPKKGIMVFALPGEPGLTELAGDFKIQFHDRQGDFYCWLNTTMLENRKVLSAADLDGFEKRKLPSPGFQVEVVLIDYDALNATRTQPVNTSNESVQTTSSVPVTSPSSESNDTTAVHTDPNKNSANTEKDDVFSDNEGHEMESSKGSQAGEVPQKSEPDDKKGSNSGNNADKVSEAVLTNETKHLSLGSSDSTQSALKKDSTGGSVSGTENSSRVKGDSDFKVVAADASVFTFGDEDDYESE